MSRYALLLCLLLAACGQRQSPPEPEQTEVGFPATEAHRYYIDRQGPDEYGVVCYTAGSVHISCVKVTP